MLMWPMGDEDTFDDIPDYDGHADHLSLGSKDEQQTELEEQYPQEYLEMPEEKLNWQEQVQMIHLRSHLNKLLETLRHAQYIADKTREEHKKCRYEIEQYEDEREKLCREIQTNEDEGNKSAVPRLQATLKRLCNELEAEQKLESVIRDQLEQAEYELALAEVERGKFILAEDNLLQKEHQLGNEKVDMAMIRLQKEQLSASNAVTSKKKDKRKFQDALNDTEKRHIQAIEEAEKSHERANKYLSKTLAKLKKRQQEEQDRYTADMARKMDMLLKLKSDIANNRENLRVIWARDTATAKQKRLAEEEEMNKIHTQGGNAEEILLIKKRKNEVEKKKQQFDAEQKLKRASIVQKILKEEESFKRRMELQPYLWTDPGQEKALRLCPVQQKPPKALRDYIAASANEKVEVEKTDKGKQKEVQQVDVVESSDSFFTNGDYYKTLKRLSFEMKQQSRIDKLEIPTGPKEEADPPNKNKNKTNNGDEEIGNELFDERDEVNLEDDVVLLEKELNEMGEEEEDEDVDDENMSVDNVDEPSVDKDLDVPEVEEEDDIQVDLAKPEFEGLWNKETTAYKAYKDADGLQAKPVGGSKMEQEILKKTLDKTRKGIVITQVAAGKEFSGRPFYSKPNIIHFKDFVVGKCYKKKVTLTNVSYTVNYIKFLDVTDNLKNFIKISFDPPGQMSAGMTCEMTVTFQPAINEDLKGEVCFLTQTGPLQVPLMCSTKKCDLILNTKMIDFGTSVIGETLKQSFVLTNRGALGTGFSFHKVTGIKPEASMTEAYMEEPFSELLESNETLENALENIQSVDLSSRYRSKVVVNQDSRPDDKNFVHGMASENAMEELKLETMPEVPFEDAVVRNTSSPTPADQISEHPPTKSEQIIDKRISFEAAELKITTSSLPKVDQGIAEEVGETKEETAQRSSQELDRVSEKASTPYLISQEEEDISSLDGLKVGPLFAGKVDPFSSVRLEIIWHPTIPGETSSEFIVEFADPEIEPLSVYAVANAIDVPVWMERQTVDLKICMFDRLYQDTVVINNRATIAQKLQFEVCKELRNHLELLPKTGYVQANSQFSAQLKFLPRQSLFKEAANFFDTETGVLEAPMIVRVGGQVTPVCFTLQAVVTTSDLEFDICDIDFGCCTVHESVKKTLKLTNKSILPQQYGFVGLPECLEVQPNDGFGTLLPLETLELDVIFSPKTAKDYKINLLVRNLISRDFCIPCKGVGVLTPLELSQQVIHFCATSLYDTSSVALHVMNNHTSTNEFSHPVPRIGKGEVCPVGPTSFEFKVPEDAPITISPSVGTILPGQKLRVEVRFSPTLSHDDIRLEAVKILLRLEEEREENEREEAARREKQELENLQQETVEPKPKKAAKQIDANINNLKGANYVTEDMQVDDIINQHEFGVFEIFENEATNCQMFNSSENKSQQNYNMFENSDTDCDKFSDIFDYSSQTGKDKSIYLKSCSKKCCIANEKSGPHRIISKVPDMNVSICQNVTRCIPHDEERTGNSLQRNLNRMISSRQEEKNIKKLSRDLPEGISKNSARRRHPKEHNVEKLLDRTRADTSKTMALKTRKMNTRSSGIPDVDNNNNMVENKDDDIENRKASLSKRSVERLHKPADSKSTIDTFSNTALMFMDQKGENIDSDWHAGVGKTKSSSLRMSLSKSKHKLSSTQSIIPSAQDLMSKFDPDNITSDSHAYREGVASLMQQFNGHLQSVTVPCYVASGKADNPGELNYSIHNTLYLEVHCPAVRPPVIVISDNGRRTVDFGSASVGQTCSQSVTVMNISDKEIKLKASALNPAGPFQILNALRAVSPGATHTLLLTFKPNQDYIFQENLGIKTLNSTLHLTLKGCGVRPLVNLSIEDGLFDLKAVLVGEFVERPFMIENCSPLAISFTIKQDSLSPLCHDKAQILPSFLAVHESHKTKTFVGPQNKSGRSVFDIVPGSGTINAGETKEVIVTFAPDHESDLFSDGVRIELFCQESSFFQVIGQGKSQVMFLEGCDPLEPPIKSLAYLSKQGPDEEASGPSMVSQSALITIHSVMKGDSFEPGIRNIFIGCVRTMSPNQKKNGDFTVDGLQSLLQKGFTVQPQKGSVDANSKTVVVITWLPPPDYDPNSIVEETVTLTLKGDITEQIPIVIRAMIVSE